MKTLAKTMMIRRIAFSVLCWLSFAIAMWGQTTNVSGQIIDANGQTFANGSYSIQFYPNGLPGPFYQNGAPFTPPTFNGALDGSGSFPVSAVPSNNTITPVGTQWSFTVCPAASATCYSTHIIVTGSTMNVTSLITPPAIQVQANAYNQPTAYQDSEIVGATLGFQYFNLTTQVLRVCTFPACVWQNSGGGGAGNPALPFDCVQVNNAGVFGTVPGFCFDSVLSPTVLTDPVSLIVTGSATVNGNAAAGNVALKYPIGDSIQYVDSSGNDSNDGLSAGTAKLTPMAAYDALPATGGTISIAAHGNGTFQPTSTFGQGFWIMGPNDPNYSSPPAGWRKYKPFKFDCVAGNTPNVLTGRLMCQFEVPAPGPGIWLSSIGGSLEFDNIAIQYPAIDVQIGVDSTGAQTVTSGVQGLTFENMATANCNGSCPSSNGPGWLIGGGDTSNLILNGIYASANVNATIGSDNQAAILVKPASSMLSSVGLATLSNSLVAGGGVKFYGGTNGSGLYIDNLYSEQINGGSVGVATVWVVSGPNTIIAKDITTSDYSGTVYDLRVDNGGPGDEGVVACIGAFAVGVLGPCTLVGSILDPLADPLVEGQTGFNQGRAYGFIGNTQRAFVPSAVRYANLASTLTSSWSASQTSGTTTFTQGINAPDGTTGAGQAANTGTPRQALTLGGSSQSIAVGDYLIGGFFERNALATPGGQNFFLDADAINNVELGGSGNTISCTNQTRLYPPFPTDGEWDWVYQLCTVTAAATSPATVTLNGFFNSMVTLQAYAPTLIHIPTGTVSPNEASEIANNLNPYNSTCSVATVCGISGLVGGTVTHSTGALTSGQPVLGNGGADVAVGPINLAGGSSYVTGILPGANSTAQVPSLTQTPRVFPNGYTPGFPGTWATYTAGQCPGGSGATFVANKITNTSYLIQSSDFSCILARNGASAMTDTLPQAGTTGFGSFFYLSISNWTSSFADTITTTTSTFSCIPSSACSGSTLTLPAGQVVTIWSPDSANWFAVVAPPTPTFGVLADVQRAATGGTTPPISATALFTAPSNGAYRITYEIGCTTSGTGTITLTVSYADLFSGVSTSVPNNAACGTPNSPFPFSISVASAGVPTYALSKTGTVTTYNVNILVEGPF